MNPHNANDQSPMQSSFSDLISRARDGDKTALTGLYEATHQDIYRTIHAMIRSEDLTMDIQQDTYIHAFSHLDQLRDADSFLPWIRRIAVNQARSHLRKNTPLLFSDLAPEDQQDPEIPDVCPETSPDLALDRKETSRLVREILDELSDGQRMLVGMYYYEQIPLKQISDSLGLSQSAVKSALYRSRKKIEDAVRRLERNGVKLYGLSPLAFLLGLLKSSKPAAEAGGKALPAILSKTGADTIALHVGRRFFETAAGKAVLGLLSTALIGGGILGYRVVKDLNDKARLNEPRLHYEQTETLPEDTSEQQSVLQEPAGLQETEFGTAEQTDPTEDSQESEPVLNVSVPVQPPVPRPTDTAASGTPDANSALPTQGSSDLIPTEFAAHEPAQPQPDQLAPSDRDPSQSVSAQSRPDQSAPTDQDPSQPVPAQTETAEPTPDLPADTAEDLIPKNDTPEDLSFSPTQESSGPSPIGTLSTDCPVPDYLGEFDMPYSLTWSYSFPTDMELQVSPLGNYGGSSTLSYSSSYSNGIQTIFVGPNSGPSTVRLYLRSSDHSDWSLFVTIHLIEGE